MKGFRTGLLAFALAQVPAFASGIQYVCASSGSDAIPSNVCTTLQTTIASQYASVFTDANAIIYIEYGNIGTDVGANTQYYNTVSYSTYYNALQANESGTSDVTAVNSLGGGTTNPVVAGDGVALTSALAQALGISGGNGICTNATDQYCNYSQGCVGVSTCTNACYTISVAADCYNDIIQISNSTKISLYYDADETSQYTSGEYDFFTAVEHETDEALGTASCLENGAQVIDPGCMNGETGTSAADLFRYSGPGTRSYIGPGGDQSDGSLAYFSINGGVTEIAPYNNTTVGDGDWGDWANGTNCEYVQAAYGCDTSSGLNILNDGGVELAVLDAVGYNLTPLGVNLSAPTDPPPVPEPETFAMAISGLGLIADLIRRQRRSERGHAAEPPTVAIGE